VLVEALAVARGIVLAPRRLHAADEIDAGAHADVAFEGRGPQSPLRVDLGIGEAGGALVLGLAILRLGEIAFAVRQAREHAERVREAIGGEQAVAALAQAVDVLVTLGLADLVPVEGESEAGLRDAFLAEGIEGRVTASADRAGE
jgi:hypothetical protein